MRGHAKSVRPSPAGVLQRERLFRRLDEAAARAQRVWIAGPPGAGKTTLAATWVASRRHPCLWLRLDEADADPATFVGELARAARVAAPGARLPRFGPEYALGLEAFFRTFFRRLLDALPRAAVLVLDNAQAVPPASPLFALIREGLGELPPGAAALVASRELPPPPFEALRVSGALELLEPGELLLDEGEVRAAARLRGLEGPEAIAGLVEASGGWAAGVALLLGSPGELRGPARTAHPSPRTFAYLASEVLDRMDPGTRRVLLETSVLPWVDAHAAEARLGVVGAAEALERLARQGWFTVRLEGEPARYRFHPLFHALLERRAGEELPRERLVALRRDGATLLAEVGADGSAVALLRDASAWEQLAALVSRRGPEMLAAGRARDVAAWLDLLPLELLAGSPGLRFLRGMARIGLEPGSAAVDIAAALDGFEAAGDAAGAFLAWAGAATVLVWSSDPGPLEALLARLDRLEDRFPGPLPPDVVARVGAAVIPALMYRRPRDPRLLRWLARNEPLAFADPVARVQAVSAMAIFDVNCSGRLSRARRVLDEVAGWSWESDPVVAVMLASCEGIYRLVTGDAEGSLEVASRGLELSASTGARLWDFLLTAEQSWAASLAGRADLAEAADVRLAALHDASKPVLGYWLHCARAFTALGRRDRARAYEEARTSRLCAEAAGCEVMVSLALAGEASCAGLGGAPPGEGPSLEQALEFARRTGCCWAEHAVLVGLAARERRDGGPALGERLSELFGTSRERGYRHPGYLYPDELADLCAVALDRGIEPDCVRAWVTTFRLAPPAWAQGLARWPWELSVRVLGTLEVARAGTAVPAVEAGRARDLLGVLVALGGRGVEVDLLASELWPDSEGDAAHHALETALYRLRRILGAPDLVVQERGRLGLAPARCFTDVWVLEGRLEALERAAAKGANGADDLHALADAVLEAYPGPLLPEVELPAVRERRALIERRVRRAVEAAERARARAPSRAG